MRKMKSHNNKGVDIMRQLKMRETDVKDLNKRIDEDAKSLALLQEVGEREKKKKEELVARIKLLEDREIKQNDLLQNYALKLLNGKGADPHPNTYTNPLNQTVAGRSMNEISGNKTQNLPAYMTKSAGLSLPNMYQGGGATSGNKTQATATPVKNDGGIPGYSTPMTGITGTLSGDKPQVTATPARNDGGIPGHSTPMTGNIGTLSGDKTQVTANSGASTNLGALDEEMILDVKITEAQILIHEAEKLFLHNRDTNILSYVLEKKKELGLAQQELLSVKKVKMLLSSTTNAGTGSPNTGPLPLTTHE